jgi:hypothetical protein
LHTKLARPKIVSMGTLPGATAKSPLAIEPMKETAAKSKVREARMSTTSQATLCL